MSVLRYYISAAVKGIFGSELRDTESDQALFNLFHHQTFRFQKNATTDRLITLRIYKSLVKAQFVKQTMLLTAENPAIAFFDSDLKHVDTRKNYVFRLTGEKPRLFIARNELRNGIAPLQSAFNLIFMALIFPLVLLISLFSKNKLKAPLHVLNTIEAIHLLHLIKKHKIENLHYFNIFEHDANLQAYVLKKNKIHVNKIASEVPLTFWNQIIVTDTLSFGFRCQEDEFNFYRRTMFVQDIQHWIPETSFDLEALYRPGTLKAEAKTVGLYSSGMWLRKRKGDIEVGNEDFQNEELLLKFLLDFVTKHAEYKLVVFLHPMEKREMVLTQEYYNNISTKITLADITVPNPKQFHKADVVVTLASTLSYERLFWGFKTLIYPKGHKNFPLQSSPFKNVCAHTEEELETKLLAALPLSAEEFFDKNGIPDYRYFYYNVFKN